MTDATAARARLRALVSRLRVPVCVAPMFLVSGPAMVVAAARAGIIGAFPTNNARTPQVLAGWMEEIAAGTQAAGFPALPWAANLVTHQTNERLAPDLALVGQYRPPVVITALGSPRPALETVHAYGGLVIADVINLKLARKAIAAGADGLACVCAGAGGHTGTLSPFAFVSAVREFFDGPLIVGGGIADGRGVAAAIMAGADLVNMGTRFIATPESIAPMEHQQMVVEAGMEDLRLSSAFTGASAFWMRQSIEQAGYDPDALPADPSGFTMDSGKRPRRWKDVFSAGQGLGAVKQIQPVADVVDTLVAQYRAALRTEMPCREPLHEHA